MANKSSTPWGEHNTKKTIHKETNKVPNNKFLDYAKKYAKITILSRALLFSWCSDKPNALEAPTNSEYFSVFKEEITNKYRKAWERLVAIAEKLPQDLKHWANEKWITIEHDNTMTVLQWQHFPLCLITTIDEYWDAWWWRQEEWISLGLLSNLQDQWKVRWEIMINVKDKWWYTNEQVAQAAEMLVRYLQTLAQNPQSITTFLGEKNLPHDDVSTLIVWWTQTPDNGLTQFNYQSLTSTSGFISPVILTPEQMIAFMALYPRHQHTLPANHSPISNPTKELQQEAANFLETNQKKIQDYIQKRQKVIDTFLNDINHDLISFMDEMIAQLSEINESEITDEQKEKLQILKDFALVHNSLHSDPHFIVPTSRWATETWNAAYMYFYHDSSTNPWKERFVVVLP